LQLTKKYSWFYAIPHQVIHQGRQQLGLAQTMLYLFTQQMSYTTRQQIFELRWQPAFDADPLQAAQTPANSEMVVSERRLVFAYHFPFQGIGMRPRSGGATLGSQLSGT